MKFVKGRAVLFWCCGLNRLNLTMNEKEIECNERDTEYIRPN